MEITKTAIHKLTAKANCGCIAAGEYKDALFKQQITLTTTSCARHTEVPDVVAVLKEVVIREAIDAKAPPEVHHEPAYQRPTAVTNAPALPGPTVITNGAIKAPVAPPARPSNPGSHRPTPRVAVAAGVHRVSPGSISSKTAAARSGLTMAPASAPMNMDEEPEDERVTNMLEETGILDSDEDIEGFE